MNTSPPIILEIVLLGIVLGASKGTFALLTVFHCASYKTRTRFVRTFLQCSMLISVLFPIYLILGKVNEPYYDTAMHYSTVEILQDN